MADINTRALMLVYYDAQDKIKHRVVLRKPVTEDRHPSNHHEKFIFRITPETNLDTVMNVTKDYIAGLETNLTSYSQCIVYVVEGGLMWRDDEIIIVPPNQNYRYHAIMTLTDQTPAYQKFNDDDDVVMYNKLFEATETLYN